MSKVERCDVCSRKPENGYEGRCSHVDCPYRPVAWSDFDIPERDRTGFERDEDAFERDEDV